MRSGHKILLKRSTEKNQHKKLICILRWRPKKKQEQHALENVCFFVYWFWCFSSDIEHSSRQIFNIQTDLRWVEFATRAIEYEAFFSELRCLSIDEYAHAICSTILFSRLKRLALACVVLVLCGSNKFLVNWIYTRQINQITCNEIKVFRWLNYKTRSMALVKVSVVFSWICCCGGDISKWWNWFQCVEISLRLINDLELLLHYVEPEHIVPRI